MGFGCRDLCFASEAYYHSSCFVWGDLTFGGLRGPLRASRRVLGELGSPGYDHSRQRVDCAGVDKNSREFPEPLTAQYAHCRLKLETAQALNPQAAACLTGGVASSVDRNEGAVSLVSSLNHQSPAVLTMISRVPVM